MDPVRLLLELAPLAGEEARGAYVAARLPGARRDGMGNVWAGEGRILLLAHLDTVLPPVPPRRLGERLYGPGVGDNSGGVAVLLSLPEIPGVVRGFTVGRRDWATSAGLGPWWRRFGLRWWWRWTATSQGWWTRPWGRCGSGLPSGAGAATHGGTGAPPTRFSP